MENRRIKLTIEYDGTNFAGYQVQPGKRTVQGVLEEALEKIFNERVITYASGRTDAGVHALNATIHFDMPKLLKHNNIPAAINAYLPADVQVLKAEIVDNSFDARFGVKVKTYGYKFYLSRYDKPLYNNRALRLHEKIDVEKMNEACKFLVGEHDFTSFVARKSGKTNFVRTIYDAKIEKTNNNEYMFIISGNGFLYNMVRIIVGTLINVGMGKIEPAMVKQIIEAKDRSKAGKTAPAYGLYMLNVEYF